MGVFDGVFGSDNPESPLSAAILRARISDPNFNGNVEYEFVALAASMGLGINPNPNNQLLGEFLQVRDVPGEVEVETFAVGLRNSYDLVYTTQGNVFATVPRALFLDIPTLHAGYSTPDRFSKMLCLILAFPAQMNTLPRL